MQGLANLLYSDVARNLCFAFNTRLLFSDLKKPNRSAVLISTSHALKYYHFTDLYNFVKEEILIR